MPTPGKRITTPSHRPAKAQPAITVGAINIRVRPEERALIDQAAVLSGKSRSEFMLEAARRAATDAILDRTLFRTQPAAYAKFQALLDAPPNPNGRLCASGERFSGVSASGQSTGVPGKPQETCHSARRPVRRRARLVWELAEEVPLGTSGP